MYRIPFFYGRNPSYNSSVQVVKRKARQKVQTKRWYKSTWMLCSLKIIKGDFTLLGSVYRKFKPNNDIIPHDRICSLKMQLLKVILHYWAETESAFIYCSLILLFLVTVLTKGRLHRKFHVKSVVKIGQNLISAGHSDQYITLH